MRGPESWNPLDRVPMDVLVPGVVLGNDVGRRELGGVTPERVAQEVEDLASMPDLRGEPARE
ncbi:hypothetical protein KKA02_00620 [Patescibacteria group bacterium]|nr:hypothetical protein [Patescibacteria group bacterium]